MKSSFRCEGNNRFVSQISLRKKYNKNMFNPPLRFRPFETEDLAELIEIDRVCFPDDIAFSCAELSFYLNHAQSIACIADGAGGIVGFVLARIETRSRAHVLTLDVIPEARRRKIGTALMDALHSELAKRGVGTAILEVAVRNLPAQRLYQRLRYQYLETLSGYYKGRDDAYRMVRLAVTANSRTPL
jgi:[ribosomal protein S18]-alanine N-acetyltransferase